jgi:hypothetical protein
MKNMKKNEFMIETQKREWNQRVGTRRYPLGVNYMPFIILVCCSVSA